MEGELSVRFCGDEDAPSTAGQAVGTLKSEIPK